MLLYTFFICILLPLLVDCTCPSESLEWKSNCYFFKTEQVGFVKAEAECVKIGGHLSSIHDAFTNNVIGQNAFDYFQHNNVSDFWIGGNAMNSENTWEWTDNTTFDFLDWNNGEPQNTTKLNCMSLSTMDGYWRAVNCFQAKPFVCAVDSSTIFPTTPAVKSCTDGWAYFEPTDSCYIAFSPNEFPDRDWQWAENFCLTFGAHSPSIHSEEEQALLLEYVDKFQDGTWLGIYSDDNGTTWQNTDNSPVDYLHWGIGEPRTHEGKNCVLLATDIRAELGWFEVAPCDSLVMTTCKKRHE